MKFYINFLLLIFAIFVFSCGGNSDSSDSNLYNSYKGYAVSKNGNLIQIEYNPVKLPDKTTAHYLSYFVLDGEKVGKYNKFQLRVKSDTDGKVLIFNNTGTVVKMIKFSKNLFSIYIKDKNFNESIYMSGLFVKEKYSPERIIFADKDYNLMAVLDKRKKVATLSIKNEATDWSINGSDIFNILLSNSGILENKVNSFTYLFRGKVINPYNYVFDMISDGYEAILAFKHSEREGGLGKGFGFAVPKENITEEDLSLIKDYFYILCSDGTLVGGYFLAFPKQIPEIVFQYENNTEETVRLNLDPLICLPSIYLDSKGWLCSEFNVPLLINKNSKIIIYEVSDDKTCLGGW